jgi:hypothetical protein
VLGRPAPEVWSEAWPLVGPQADAVLQSGRSWWNEELLIVMTRNGYSEEVYMTFAYGPILNDDASVAGLFWGERALHVIGAAPTARQP